MTTSFLVTLEDAALAAGQAALQAIEGATVTSIAPAIEQDIITLAQTGFNDIVNEIGTLFSKFTAYLTPSTAIPPTAPSTSETALSTSD